MTNDECGEILGLVGKSEKLIRTIKKFLTLLVDVEIVIPRVVTGLKIQIEENTNDFIVDVHGINLLAKYENVFIESCGVLVGCYRFFKKDINGVFYETGHIILIDDDMEEKVVFTGGWGFNLSDEKTFDLKYQLFCQIIVIVQSCLRNEKNLFDYSTELAEKLKIKN